MISPELAKLSNRVDGLAPATLHIDVIADLICPWSYLGKRRLDEALSAVHGPSRVNWHPFQINPTMPEEGMAFDDYLKSKIKDPEKLTPTLVALREAGRGDGIEFRFDRLSRVPNTMNAHRLMHLAAQEGADTSALADAIFRAFFENGRNIGDTDVLLQLGLAAQLSESSVQAMLSDESSKRQVIAKESEVRKSGVTGVPDFLINQRMFVIGAQPTENLVSIFDRAMFGEESSLEVSSTVH